MIFQSVIPFAEGAPRFPRHRVRKQHRAGVAPLVLGLAMAAGHWGCSSNGGTAGSGQNGAGSGMAAMSGVMGGSTGVATGPSGGLTGPTSGSGSTGPTSGSGASSVGLSGSTVGSGVSSGDSVDAGGGTSGAMGGVPDATGGDGSFTNPPDSVVWLFDNLKTIGTNPSYNLTLGGAPMVIDTPAGKAIQFNGTNDALDIPKNPLDIYTQWTAEIIFRLDTGGAQAQRWFHIAGTGGMGTGERVLFELRYNAANDTWFQVAFVQGGATGRLFGYAFPHPAGKWYHVAIVIDGKTMKPYVNGVWEPAGNCAGEACTPANLTAPFPLAYKPIGAGATRVGSRYGGSAWLKGAVRIARFTPRALTPAEFIPPPY